MDELLKEKAEIEAKILAKQKEAKAATRDAYWLKKRVKLIESKIAAMPAEQTPGEAIQDISKGLS